MTQVMDERAQFQQQYATGLQQKSEFEGVMKEKNEARERDRKYIKEKDETRIMAQKT